VEAEAIFKFLWKQEADAEAVLKVLLPLPLLPNIKLTFLLKLLVPVNLLLYVTSFYSAAVVVAITATHKAFILQKIKNYGSSSSMEKWKQETEALKIVGAKALRLLKRMQETRPVIWKRKRDRLFGSGSRSNE